MAEQGMTDIWQAEALMAVMVKRAERKSNESTE
jgi:hypothetical protein